MSFFSVATIVFMVLQNPSDAKDYLSPSEEYICLVRDWEQASRDYQREVQAARLNKTEHASDLKHPTLIYQERFLEFARKNPRQSSAVDSFVWMLVHPWEGPQAEKNYSETLQVLTRDFLADRKLADACAVLGLPFNATTGAGGFHSETERLLRTAAQRSPHRRVRASACFSLACFLREKAKHRPAGMTELEAATTAEESSHYFEEVVERYKDIEVPNDRTYGDLASSALFESRNLVVGKLSPDIEGLDLDGKPMKLSDFRGNVVVLSFWATWCGPCMAMVPHEQSLTKRLAKRPFVLLGINGDHDRSVANARVIREGITWRSWSEGRDGLIIRRWNIMSWPTVYVLDAQGVIRYKDIRGTELDQAVDSLLTEVKP